MATIITGLLPVMRCISGTKELFISKTSTTYDMMCCGGCAPPYIRGNRIFGGVSGIRCRACVRARAHVGGASLPEARRVTQSHRPWPTDQGVRCIVVAGGLFVPPTEVFDACDCPAGGCMDTYEGCTNPFGGSVLHFLRRFGIVMITQSCCLHNANHR